MTTTAPINVTRTSRTGLWCDQCNRSTRVELDIANAGAHVATLTGCQPCRSGLFAASTP